MNDFSFPIAVIMERIALNNRWASERWQAKGVVPDVGESDAGNRIIVNDDRSREILFPGFHVRLSREEGHGYYLNVSTPTPKVFVLWRMHDDIARPESVTVSYGEAARWMDSSESVDAVPMPPELQPWVRDFVDQHYRPEPREKGKRKRERYR